MMSDGPPAVATVRVVSAILPAKARQEDAAGELNRNLNRASEPVAVTDSEIVDALVFVRQIGVRQVLEINGEAVVLVETEADLKRDVKEHAAAERLPIRGFEVKIAGVNSGADTSREEDAARRLDLPAGIEVSVAGVAMEVDRPAQRRADRTPKERQRRREDHLCIEVHGLALAAEAAPQVIDVVGQSAS